MPEQPQSRAVPTVASPAPPPAPALGVPATGLLVSAGVADLLPLRRGLSPALTVAGLAVGVPTLATGLADSGRPDARLGRRQAILAAGALGLFGVALWQQAAGRPGPARLASAAGLGVIGVEAVTTRRNAGPSSRPGSSPEHTTKSRSGAEMSDRTNDRGSGGNGGTTTLTRSPTTADPAVAGRTGQPGRRASAPWGIPIAEWLVILKRAWVAGKEHHVSLLAAGVAFFGLLAIFPAIIATVTVYGLVSDPADVERQVQDLASGLPEDARSLLTSALTSIASTSSGSLTVSLVISVLAALWAASGGVNNLVQAIGIAYREQDDRNMVRKRGLSLLLTLGAIVFVLAAVALIAVLPGLLEAAGLGAFADTLIGLLRWLGLVVAMLVALGVLYRLAPDRADARWAWVSVGAVAATVLWVVGSILFSVYVDNFGSYQKTYGAIAGVIVLMLWLYLSAYAVLFGAEVNAEAELQTARDTTTGPEEPMGERGAYVADRVAR